MQRSEGILSRCHDNLKPDDFLSGGFRIELASSIDSHAEYPYMEILFQSVMMIQLLRVSSKPNEQKSTAILIFWSFTVVRGLPCVHLSGRNWFIDVYWVPRPSVGLFFQLSDPNCVVNTLHYPFFERTRHYWTGNLSTDILLLCSSCFFLISFVWCNDQENAFKKDLPLREKSIFG